MKDINYYKFVSELAKVLISFCDDFDSAMKVNSSEYKTDRWFKEKGEAFERTLQALLMNADYRQYHQSEFATTFVTLGDVFYDSKKAFFKKKIAEDGTAYYERRSADIAKEGRLHDAIIASKDLIEKSLKSDGDEYLIDARKKLKGSKIEYDTEIYYFLVLKSLIDIFTIFTSNFYLADEIISIAHKYQYLFEESIKNGAKYIVRDSNDDFVCNKNNTWEHVPYYHYITAETKEEVEAYKEKTYLKGDRFAVCILEDNSSKKIENFEIDEEAISKEMEKNKKSVVSKTKSFFKKLFKHKK